MVALGPTAASAQVLGQAINVEGRTLDAFLLSAQREKQPAEKRALWILDEASLAGTEKIYELMRQAVRHDAKLVLVGDVKQLGSVEAGAAFKQLQEAGMRTAELDVILRQTNSALREAIYDTLKGNAVEALRRIASGGGNLTELNTPVKRYAAARGIPRQLPRRASPNDHYRPLE